jgi:hypothetical protein
MHSQNTTFFLSAAAVVLFGAGLLFIFAQNPARDSKLPSEFPTGSAREDGPQGQNSPQQESDDLSNPSSGQAGGEQGVATPVPSSSGDNMQGDGSSPSLSVGVSAQSKLFAETIIRALRDKDFAKLSSYVGASGVRFSPYVYVDTVNDQVFTADQVKNLWQNASVYTWGHYDGSGEPIELTFRKYYEKFVYDKDFARAPEVIYGQPSQEGNMVNNIQLVYPNAQVVEYHIPPSQDAYLDWASVFLIFEQQGDAFQLIGVVHSQWTI